MQQWQHGALILMSDHSAQPGREPVNQGVYCKGFPPPPSLPPQLGDAQFRNASLGHQKAPLLLL